MAVTAIAKRDMNKSDFVEVVLNRLEQHFGKPRHIARFEPMDELISCILSQHSSDALTFPAFTRLKETFLTWDDVANAGPGVVAEVIRKAGLANQKSKSIVSCLKSIHQFAGSYSLEFLREMNTNEAVAWLKQLPGVGPKTASIVLSFSMGHGTVPVDTHVFRVSWRLGIIPKEMGEVKAHDYFMGVVPSSLAFRYHVDLIQHGRMICKARQPGCDRCPISDLCDWHKIGLSERHPTKLSPRRQAKGKTA